MDISVRMVVARARRHLSDHRVFYSIFLPFVLIVLLASVTLYLTLVELRLTPLRKEQLTLIDTAKSSILRELGQIERTPGLIAGNPDVRSSLQADQPLAIDTLADEFVYLSKLSPLISQIRWLDANGQERIRINSDGGVTEIVPEDRLQSKQHRDYFSETLSLGPGKTYLSEIDLNIEHGEIVWPLEPTVRAAVRTGSGDGLREGVLIVNFQLTPLFSSLRQLADDTHQLEIVNSNGFWLLHPDTSKEWGFLEDSESHGLATTNPNFWNQVTQAAFGNGLVMNGHMHSFTKVRFSSAPSEPLAATQSPDMVILARSHDSLVSSIRLTNGLFAAACGLLLIIGAGVLGWQLCAAFNRENRLKRKLHREGQDLKRAYRSLLSAHERTVMLQNELVETRKLSSLGMVVAGVAQELNQPTSAAMLNIEDARQVEHDLEFRLRSMETWPSLEPEFVRCRERLDLAHDDLRQVDDIINSFKRLAVDRTLQAVELFQLAGRVDDVLTAMESRLQHQNVLVTTYIPDAITMESYPGIFSLVIQNIIDNALEHAFGEREPGSIVIQARVESGRDIIVEIQDNGRGIDAHILERVFDPFVTSARKSGHIGLGMHFVHQWVHQLLQGIIAVESNPGEGTRFIITIPMTMPQPSRHGTEFSMRSSTP